jgi:hypothetical protein
LDDKYQLTDRWIQGGVRGRTHLRGGGAETSCSRRQRHAGPRILPESRDADLPGQVAQRHGADLRDTEEEGAARVSWVLSLLRRISFPRLIQPCCARNGTELNKTKQGEPWAAIFVVSSFDQPLQPCMGLHAHTGSFVMFLHCYGKVWFCFQKLRTKSKLKREVKIKIEAFA